MEELKFGTDGIRNQVGVFPFTLLGMEQLAATLGTWICKKSSNPTILIAQDTRISGHMLKAALKSRLLMFPVIIHDAHVVPTSGVCALMAHDSTYDLGIVLTASHNPYTDNGIKLFKKNGAKLSADDEREIMNLFNKSRFTESYTNLGTEIQVYDAGSDYMKIILKHFPHLNLANRTIVLDTAHGSTYSVAPQIFAHFGVTIIHLNNEPTGKNINDNSGSEYPEHLRQAVVKHQADIGFAFDGDGDRVIAISRDGILKDGDDLLAILSTHPKYQHQTTIVGTVMTNQGLETFLRNNNKTLHRTAVGDKHVVRALQEHNLLLGGEQTGHIALNDYLPMGDGIFTALRLLETLECTRNWTMHSFEKYPQILINVPIIRQRDLNDPEIVCIIQKHKDQLGSGRLLIRYSGTQNLLRVMVEEENEKKAHELAHHLAQELAEQLV